MMHKLGTVYYISKKNIEWIYRNNFGPNIDKTYKSKYEQRKELSLKVGLEKLYAALTGTTISGKGTIVKNNTKEEEITFKESVEDRTLVLINELFTKDNVSDVKEITIHQNPNTLYSFCLPLEISELFKPKGSGTSIEVSYHSDNLHFSGSTSSENWISNSLVNNILYSGSFKASGIFMPLKVINENNIVKLTVQYLVIGHPIIFGEQNV